MAASAAASGINSALSLLGSSRSQLYCEPARAGFLLSSTSHRRRRSTAIARASSSSSSAAESGEKSNSDAPRKEAVRSSSSGGVERRQLLVATAAAGLAAAASPARAAPIAAPDLSLCKLATYEEGGPGAVDPTPREVQCCPPFGPDVKIVDFTFPSREEPLRVRKAAHKLTDAEKERYERAYAAIKALPDDHPHSLYAQANVHCAYCNNGYFQQDGKTPLQVHDSWLFLPFHRWYLYFHERILAKYAGEDGKTLAIPFWNWDNQDPNEKPVPNEIPDLFLNPKYPTLRDAIRNTAHFPPNLVDFTRGKVSQSTPQKLRDCNTALLYQNLVDGARTSSLFFGGAYRAGDADTPGGGRLEDLPHGPPHGWTGGPVTDPKSPAGEDMGNFYSAGRDPIFYSHHSNVDRMWTVWKTLPGRGGRPGRKDPDDPDFLNSSFLFYDENLDLVRVYVRDSLDAEALRFKYADAPDAWKDYDVPKVVPRPEGGRRRRRQGIEVGDVTDASLRGPGERQLRLASTAEGSTFKVSRPDRPQRKGRRRGGKRSPQPVPAGEAGDDDEEEEILVVQGVTVPITKTVSFDIFLDLDDDVTDPDACLPNYVGSFYNVAHSAPGGATERVTNLRVGIGNKLKQLNITDISDLEVTVIEVDESDKIDPKKRITVAGFSIEYE